MGGMDYRSDEYPVERQAFASRLAGVIDAIFFVAIWLVLVGSAVAAPKLKPTEVPPETVPGILQFRMTDCPVVQCGAPGETQLVYWLVFTDRDHESRVRGIPGGTPVRVVGHVARGGEYRYVIVLKCIRDD